MSSRHRFALYWCTTSDGDEDWFVVASSTREARRFHEDAEGFAGGDAYAERVCGLPPALQIAGKWRNGPGGRLLSEAWWPTDELLIACGAEIIPRERTPMHDTMGVVQKDVRLAGRLFRSGDVTAQFETGGANALYRSHPPAPEGLN